MDFMLETSRLIIRKLTLDDVEAMHAILSDPVTMQFWPKPFDREGSERWVSRSVESYSALGFGRYAVITKDSDRLIGDCGFIRLEVNGTVEYDLGYILDKSQWGKGYATEAANACLDYGFTKLGFERVVATMETRHLASKAVAEKLGLRVEKQFINPRNRDLPTLLLSITRQRAMRTEQILPGQNTNL